MLRCLAYITGKHRQRLVERLGGALGRFSNGLRCFDSCRDRLVGNLAGFAA
jgi:hypothetical protein